MNKEQTMQSTEDEIPSWAFWGVLGSTVATSACCTLPTLLISLGLGGTWVSQLYLLRPYRPYFVALALLFFVLGFYFAWRRKKYGCPVKPAS